MRAKLLILSIRPTFRPGRRLRRCESAFVQYVLGAESRHALGSLSASLHHAAVYPAKAEMGRGQPKTEPVSVQRNAMPCNGPTTTTDHRKRS